MTRRLAQSFSIVLLFLFVSQEAAAQSVLDSLGNAVSEAIGGAKDTAKSAVDAAAGTKPPIVQPSAGQPPATSPPNSPFPGSGGRGALPTPGQNPARQPSSFGGSNPTQPGGAFQQPYNGPFNQLPSTQPRTTTDPRSTISPPTATDRPTLPNDADDAVEAETVPANPSIGQQPSLGVTVTDAAAGRVGAMRGAVITALRTGGAAEAARLPIGGVIVRYDARPIGSPTDLIAAVSSSKVGQSVELSYYHGSQLFRKNVKIGSAPKTVAVPARQGGGLAEALGDGGRRPALGQLGSAIDNIIPGLGPNRPAHSGEIQPGAATTSETDVTKLQQEVQQLRQTVQDLQSRVQGLERLLQRQP